MEDIHMDSHDHDHDKSQFNDMHMMDDHFV
jgi:hypothetical protein